jgi:aerobic carbon-monoxide dehydrogenase medium subunit
LKPPPFAYFRPDSAEEAVALLASHGDDAKILAGGQSLVPLLNFRMLRPGVLIDINRVSGLDLVAGHGDGLRIGALNRHHALEMSPLVRQRFPLIAAAMGHVAHLAIRNRGTIGGSLAHADPAAELPMLALLLDAEIHTQSAAGAGCQPADGFFAAPLTTTLAADEIVTEIVLPALPPHTGWGFEEFARRHGDFAIAAAAATMTLSAGRVAVARLAVAGVGPTPLRLRAVEAALSGHAPAPALLAEAARQLRDFVEPNTDLHASADFRRHLAVALSERALTAAWRRATELAA